MDSNLLQHAAPEDSVSVGNKPRLSSLIKLSRTKSRILITKKSLPPARHERFDNRKPWRRSQPRYEKRLLVKATLDRSLRVLSRHQSQLLNGEAEGTAAAGSSSSSSSSESAFDDVDLGSWTLVRKGDRAIFEENKPEAETATSSSATSGKRGRDIQGSEVNTPNDNNKRFKADWNNNDKTETDGNEIANGANDANNDDEDDDVIIDVESEGEPEKQESATELNWQWLPATNNVGFYPPPPPPIYPPPPPPIYQPLPPHLLQPQPAAAYDYYSYCVRFFYHHPRFCAAREMTESNASFVS